MKKVAEGRFSDMAHGAWKAIKSGGGKVWNWISEIFCPRIAVKEEKMVDLVHKFDDYLGEVEAQVG